jgi:uncharacterized protein YbcC (UPF0753/DUF2309 family)
MMAETNGQDRPTAEDWKELNEKLKLANSGDQKAIQWLRKFLDDHPQVWGALGDLTRVAEKAWIDLISNKDALAAESIRRQLSQLKTDLVGESPSPVEKMLGDQVVATWLETRYLEATSADVKGASMTQSTLLLKRVESAQRRHLNAIRSLVQTRKLLTAGSTNPVLRIFPSEREAS